MNFASFSSKLPLIACGALVMLSSACVSTGSRFSPGSLTQPFPNLFAPKPAENAPAIPGRKRVWTGEGVSGAPSITILLSEQRAFFSKGKQVVGETDISSGRDGYDTPPGRYQVIQKDRDHRSTLYGDFVNGAGEVVRANVDIHKDSPPAGASFLGAKMPYFLRFRAGYGLHAGWLPGHRASHGCVRLPKEMAAHFFENAPVGTPVYVRP